MKILTKDEVNVNKEVILEVMKNGALFIHPTDTIYGIGCNATEEEFVDEVRGIKGRPDSPFSVIAPSKKWIIENCVVDKKLLKKLPGKYTLIFKLKKKAVVKEVNMGLDSLGVRIPKHWISNVVKKLGFPVVTTSVNITGKKPMTKLEEFKKLKVDLILYEGVKKGKASTVIDARSSKILR